MPRANRAVERGGLAAAVFVTVGLVAASGPLAAQAVREARPADPEGSVKIALSTGSLRVIGWSRDSVAVSGRPGGPDAWLALEVEGPAAGIRIVTDRDAGAPSPADLEVRVPAGSQVAIRAAAASVDVSGVEGTVDVTSVSGDIRVSGSPRSVFAESGTGTLVLETTTKLVRAHSVDGDLTVRGAHGFVDASTVSGDILLEGRGLWEGEVTSVSGDIRFEGSFVSGATLFYFENHAGAIELRVPPRLVASFTITSYTGSVENRLRPGTPGSFSTGKGGPEIRIKSFKGPIRILAASPGSDVDPY